MEKEWVITQSPYPKPLQLQDISTEAVIFIATKYDKTIMAVIQIRLIIFFTSDFLPEI